MPTVEETLASLEGRVAEQTRLFSIIRDAPAALERRTDARFDSMDRRFRSPEVRRASPPPAAGGIRASMTVKTRRVRADPSAQG